jgi:hypothetical protein
VLHRLNPEMGIRVRSRPTLWRAATLIAPHTEKEKDAAAARDWRAGWFRAPTVEPADAICFLIWRSYLAEQTRRLEAFDWSGFGAHANVSIDAERAGAITLGFEIITINLFWASNRQDDGGEKS